MLCVLLAVPFYAPPPVAAASDDGPTLAIGKDVTVDPDGVWHWVSAEYESRFSHEDELGIWYEDTSRITYGNSQGEAYDLLIVGPTIYDAKHVRDPSIAAAPDGSLHVAYQIGALSPEGSSIGYIHNALDLWSTPQTVVDPILVQRLDPNPNTDSYWGHALYPCISVDHDGVWRIVYLSNEWITHTDDTGVHYWYQQTILSLNSLGESQELEFSPWTYDYAPFDADTVYAHCVGYNTPPVAEDDFYETDEDVALVVPAPGVLTNDTDADDDLLTAHLLSDVSDGTLVLNADGGFTYTPDQGFSGTDSFTYRAFDGTEYSDAATVAITVHPVEEPTWVGTVVRWNGDVTVNGDPVTPGQQVGPGDVIETGEDSYTYVEILFEVEDGEFTASIRWNAYVTFDTGSTLMDILLTISRGELYGRTRGLEERRFEIRTPEAVTARRGTEWTVAVDETGTTVTVLDGEVDVYTPDGSQSLVLGTGMGLLATSEGLGEPYPVDLDAIDRWWLANTPPVAHDDAYETPFETALSVPAPGVLANDTDADGDLLTAHLLTNVASGTLVLNLDGSFLYAPAAGFSGEDTFTYRAYDGEDYSNIATVTITVHAADDPIPVVLERISGIDAVTLSVNASKAGFADGADTVLVASASSFPDQLGASALAGALDAPLLLSDPSVLPIVVVEEIERLGAEYAVILGGLSGDVEDALADLVGSEQVERIAGADRYDTASEVAQRVAAELGVEYDGTAFVVAGGSTQGAALAAPVASARGIPIILTQPGTLPATSANTLTTLAAQHVVIIGDTDQVSTAVESEIEDLVGSVTRIAGADWRSTSAAVAAYAQTAFDFGADEYVVTESDHFATDLVAGVLGGVRTGPLLYGDSDEGLDTAALGVLSDAVDAGTLRRVAVVSHEDSALGAGDTVFAQLEEFLDDEPPSNVPPVALDDEYQTDEGVLLSVHAPGVLANDTDADDDHLTAHLLTDVSDGTLLLALDGGFIYTPDAGFSGTDSFTYRAFDGYDYSEPALVTIEVLDTTPPTSSVLFDPASPDGNDDWYKTAPVVTITATDENGSGVDFIEYKFDGSAEWTRVDADVADVAGIVDGTHVLYYRATDVAGNVEDANLVSFKVDTTAPSVPVDVRWTMMTSTSVGLAWDASSDVHSGVAAYDVYDGTALVTTTVTPSVTLSGLTPGSSHTFTVVARDVAGNASGASAPLAVTLPSEQFDQGIQPGTSVETTVTVGDVEVTVVFEEVTVEGTLTVSPLPSAPAGMPTGFMILGDERYDVSFTGTFEGSIEIAFPYDPSIPDARALNLKVMHWVDNGWKDATDRVDTEAKLVWAKVTSLSPFVLAESATYTLTYSAGPGGIISDTTPQTVVHGGSGAAVTAVPDSGYQFVQWSDGITTATRTDTNVTADLDVTAIFALEAVAPDPLPSIIKGNDRYLTAIAGSQAAYPNGAPAVVIATGENFADALGGAGLAGALDSPLLLVQRDALPSAVAAEIRNLGATEAYILGGTSAVSNAVADAVRTNLAGAKKLTRIAGSNRYQTADRVAAETIKVLNATGGYSGDAFIATGANFPDALGASPVAAAKGMPVFLADPARATVPLPASVRRVWITGGTAVVSPAVESSIRAGGRTVTRFAGRDRFDTAAQVAAFGVSRGMAWEGVGITTGMNFPDALAAGPVLGSRDAVMLLTDTNAVPQYTRSALLARKAQISRVTFFGGDAAVPQSVRTTVNGLIR